MNTNSLSIDNYLKVKENVSAGDLNVLEYGNLDFLCKTGQMFIKARIELEKTGQFNNEDLLTVSNKDFWKSEYFNLKGLSFFHLNLFLEGSDFFKKAMKLSSGKRKLLFEFNYLTGIDNSTESWDWSLIPKWRILLKKSYQENHPHVSALIHRKLARFYLVHERLEASLEENKKALKIFEKESVLDDYQIALCQTIQVLLNLDKKSEAKVYFEKLIPPFSNRVKYSYTKISSFFLGEENHGDNNSYKSQFWTSHFKNQCPQTAIFEWDKRNGLLKNLKNLSSLPLADNNLEGKLINSLINKKKLNKFEIIDYLWPNLAVHGNVENRFFRLLNRINKKTNNLIQFDGDSYSLLKNTIKVI